MSRSLRLFLSNKWACLANRPGFRNSMHSNVSSGSLILSQEGLLSSRLRYIWNGSSRAGCVGRRLSPARAYVAAIGRARGRRRAPADDRPSRRGAPRLGIHEETAEARSGSGMRVLGAGGGRCPSGRGASGRAPGSGLARSRSHSQAARCPSSRAWGSILLDSIKDEARCRRLLHLLTPMILQANSTRLKL